MEAAHFFGNVKTGFSPKKTSLVRANYIKRFVAIFRFRRCLHWLYSSIRSGVMADHNFGGHCSGWRGR